MCFMFCSVDKIQRTKVNARTKKVVLMRVGWWCKRAKNID